METKQAISRRDFLQGMAAAAAIRQGSAPFSLRAQSPSSPPEKLFVFAYSDVKLTGGPLRSQVDRIHASYQGLDEDRLLRYIGSAPACRRLARTWVVGMTPMASARVKSWGESSPG